ncbi:MAG: TusE/DsrC/DsvC family sulfur relay protein [Gammaproteobacteria bacterium]
MSAVLKLGNRSVALDNEGNLVDLQDWSEAVAVLLARECGIELTQAHWDILRLLRNFHQQRGLSPVMRILVKLVEREYGPGKGNSLYLLSLFPGSPARLAAKIAGLPRPVHCI